MGLALPPGMQELRNNTIASQFVSGLNYPVAKADILAAARDATLAAEIQDTLAVLPDREYEDATDLTRALNATA